VAIGSTAWRFRLHHMPDRPAATPGTMLIEGRLRVIPFAFMVESVPDIVLITDRIEPIQLSELVSRFFVDMVKYVVDVERGIAAVGGELHADAEQLLLEDGSRQEDLWGANYYPGRGRDDCIEFTSLINIRPSQGNPSMEIEDEAIRDRVLELTHRLIGQGEELP